MPIIAQNISYLHGCELKNKSVHITRVPIYPKVIFS
jgi:hypothetical protein